MLSLGRCCRALHNECNSGTPDDDQVFFAVPFFADLNTSD